MSIDFLPARLPASGAEGAAAGELLDHQRVPRLPDGDGHLARLDQPRAQLPGHPRDQLLLGDDERGGGRLAAAHHHVLKIADELKGKRSDPGAGPALMLWVLVAFAVLLLMGMPVAFAIGISGCVFFLQHPELPSTIPIQLTISETQNFALLAVPLFILAGNLMNNAGITQRAARARHGAHRAHEGRPGAGVDRARHADGRRVGLGDRRRGDAGAHARQRDAEARLLEGLRRRRAVLRLADDADHPAGHRLHPLRHGRPGVDRAPVRRRLHPGLHAVGRAGAHDLGHREKDAATSRSARRGRPRRRSRARDLGRHLGAPVPGVPAARPALRHLHALGDRRLRRGLRGGDRPVRLPRAQARRRSRRRSRAAWSTSAR